MNIISNQSIIKFIKAKFYNTEFVPLHSPLFVGNEKKYINDAIDSTYVSSVGAYVDKFEEMIKTYTGSKYAIATVNGTSALHVSLILSGVKKNDLVLTQPFTFISTCNAISYTGAEPYFLDIDTNTLGLSANTLKKFLEKNTIKINNEYFEKKSNKRISACVPMHTFGHPCEIEDIVKICKDYGIKVIEDSAESLGSKYKDKQTGTFGLFGIYSFNGNKIITSGGGGVIITNDDELGPLAKHITTQAKISHKWEFKHDAIAFNYRMPNINAAIACAQLEQIDLYLEKKRELSKSYDIFFENSTPQFFKEPRNAISNYWLNTLVFNDLIERDNFLNFSNENGIMTRPSWEMVNKLEIYKHCGSGDLTNANYYSDRIVNIPSSVIL
jgi:aminotransferase in exopolysaccharide biosynthesis